MNNKSFNEKCYELLKLVPKGKVTTYKELANALGTKAYRAVGNAMNKNPHNVDVVPCHRVVNADGRMGGYAWEEATKVSKLEGEGVKIKRIGDDMRGWKIDNFKEVLFKFC